MKLQDQYNKMAAHMSSMTEQSKVEGYCKYKSPNGNRCAVGCLIPDDETGALKFQGGVKDLLESFPDLQWIDVALGITFQDWHDSVDSWNTSTRASYQDRQDQPQFYNLGTGGVKRLNYKLNQIAEDNDLEPYEGEV